VINVTNLEAWAIGQGYDPDHDYTQPVVPLPPGYLSPHFTEDEFRCNHCGQLAEGGVPPELVAVLEDVRQQFGSPVTINSGYRCPTHNAAEGGVEDSQHVDGTAADITVTGVPAPQVYAYLDPWHEGGLGEYDTFTHVDVRGSRARWAG
jgi:uncharacterized protein YcbK (DUF882 family)